MRLNELMDGLHPWWILLGISAHRHPFPNFQRMTHLPQQIPLAVIFWTCQHVPSSFQIPPRKGHMFGCSLPQSLLPFPLLPPLPTYTSGLIYNYFSLASLIFVVLSLTLTLYLHILGTLPPIVSPLLLCLHHYPNYPIFYLECAFFFFIYLFCLLILKWHPLYPLPSAQGCWNRSTCLPANSCSRSPNADFTSSLTASKGTHERSLPVCLTGDPIGMCKCLYI